MTKSTRVSQPFHAPDISALARHLHNSVHDATANGGAATWNHSRWLATLARATGHSNYQSWLAAQTHASSPLPKLQARLQPQPQPQPLTAEPNLHVAPASGAGSVFVGDKGRAQRPPSAHAVGLASLNALAPGLTDSAYLRILRALSYLDNTGSLLRWPTKRNLADLLLWSLWLRIDEARRYREGEITSVLAQLNHFGDPVTLRRELIGAKLLARESDGSVYWKLTKPPAEIPRDASVFLTAVRQRLLLRK